MPVEWDIIFEVYEEKVSGFKKNEQDHVFSKMLEDIKTIKLIRSWFGNLVELEGQFFIPFKIFKLLHDLKVGIYIKNFNLKP